MNEIRIDISNEFSLEKYRHGVRFAKPDVHTHHSALSIPTLLSLPFNVYFLNAGSEMIKGNEHHASTQKYDSPKHAMGKTVYDAFKYEDAAKIIKNDQHVLSSKQLFITEEYGDRLKDASLQCLTFKFPIFNEQDNVVGIFGCSVVANEHDLGHSLGQLMRTGLLNQPSKPLKAHPQAHYISAREHECMQYLIRGKSAREMGEIMGISRRTVESHIENLKNKLNATTKSELIDKIFTSFYSLL